MRLQRFNTHSILNELKKDKEIEPLIDEYRKEFIHDTKFKLKIDLDVSVYLSLDIFSCKPLDNFINEDDLMYAALRKVAPLMKAHRKEYTEKAKQFKKDALKILKKKVASIIEKNPMEKPTEEDMDYILHYLFDI